MLLKEWKKKLQTGEILANHIFDKGFVFRIYKEFSKFNNKKATNFFPMGKQKI